MFGFMSQGRPAPAVRVPSPGIDLEQFEAEQAQQEQKAAEGAEEEAKQLKSDETEEEDEETEQARAVRARCNEEEIEEVWFDDIGRAQIRFENDTPPSGQMEGRVFVIDPCAAEAEQAPKEQHGEKDKQKTEEQKEKTEGRETTQEHVMAPAASLTTPFFTYVKVNTELAMQYACCTYAQNRMYGCVSHSRYVMMILSRVRCDSLCISLHESDTAEKLGYGLRLQSGYSLPERKRGKPPPKYPDCLWHERDLDASLIGRSLNTVPKEIFWAFLGGMADTWECDLEASHQQCILKRHPTMQLPTCVELLDGAKSFRMRIVENIKATRGADVSYEAVKRLLFVMNYGGSAEKWQRAHTARRCCRLR